jgi:hypothetical protein
MRDKQRLLVVAVLGPAALLAAACGGSSGSPSSETFGVNVYVALQRYYVRGLVSGALKS